MSPFDQLLSLDSCVLEDKVPYWLLLYLAYILKFIYTM